MSKPLIRFEGSKLILVANDLPKDPVKILSIIGKARMGKSTFLNAFISKYTGENRVIFTTQDGDEHCTLGIDYYYIPEYNLLLLDSQGLAHDNSSHDPSLLLFIYLVSNLVIFNEATMLQNSALRLIEPICTFTQYLDMESVEKPSLMFRISDAKKGSDINKTLEKLMTHHDDQYNSIRESIENVFAHPVSIIKTEHPQAKDEEVLATNDYTGLLALKENGFDNAIKSIIISISELTSRPTIGQLESYVDSINNNEQITINKLDVVSLTHNNDILIWLNKVPAELKSEIEVDGTQENYEKNVVTRQANVKKLKTDFTKRFKAISETIKKEHKAKLDAELDGPIERAKANSEQKAKKFLTNNNLGGLMGEQLIGTISDVGVVNDKPALVSKYLGAYERFQKAFAHIYEPVRVIYDKMFNGMYEELNKNIELAKEVSRTQKELVKAKANEITTLFHDWAITKIKNRGASILFEKKADIYKSFRNEKIAEMEQFIIEKVRKQDVRLTIVSGNRLEATIMNSIGNISTKYELIADIYSTFVQTLDMFPLKDIDEALLKKKEEILESTLIMEPNMANKICRINPEIQFVYDPILLESCIEDYYDLTKAGTPFMMLKTWNSIYEPMYMTAMENLIADGVCDPNKSFRDFIMETPEEGTNYSNIETIDSSNKYDKNVCEMLTTEMKKVFCRMTVSGMAFPNNNIHDHPVKEDEFIAMLDKPIQ
jgi:hypothetical protein